MARQSKSEESPADYEVGRGKPPKHSRFKPGQSGNPGGRKKGSVNIKTAVLSVLESTIEVTENGQKRSVSAMEAMLLNLTQLAIRGNVKASLVMLEFAERYCDANNDDRMELPEEDLAILERMASRKRPSGKGPKSRAGAGRRSERRAVSDADNQGEDGAESGFDNG